MEEVRLSSGRIVRIKDEYVPWVLAWPSDEMTNDEKIWAILHVHYFPIANEEKLEELLDKNGDDSVMEGIAKARQLEFAIS